MLVSMTTLPLCAARPPSLHSRAFVAMRRQADVHRWLSQKWTCLFWACAYANGTDVIDELVRRGAAVNSIDEDGRTPLHEAVKYGRMASVKRLVHHGADLGAVDEVCWTLARRAALDVVVIQSSPLLVAVPRTDGHRLKRDCVDTVRWTTRTSRSRRTCG